MSSFSETQQGSLFQLEDEVQDRKSKLSLDDKELTIESLKEDAKQRPRAPKHEKEKESSERQVQNNSEIELPSWHHHSLVNKEDLTPVLRHYASLKTEFPNRVLLYRLGDFFESFFEDAILLSQKLEITLTSKEAGKKIGRVPMAGIPHHSAGRYCSELIKKGFSVAICDQLEEAAYKNGKHIKRGITRVITPGTVIEEGMLQAKKNNWLTSVVIEKGKEEEKIKWGLARADVSTGELFGMEGETKEKLKEELEKLEIAEIIFGENETNNEYCWCPNNKEITFTHKTPFSSIEARNSIKKYYSISSIEGLGIGEYHLAKRAIGGLINYIQETNPDEINENKILLNYPIMVFEENSLIIDLQTKRNLEIIHTQRDNQYKGSLLWSIDNTLTSMGGRCLRRWIESPLTNKQKIINRQNIISSLVHSKSLRKSSQNLLRSIADLERLAGRAGAGQAGARDLVSIAQGLKKLPRFKSLLNELESELPDWLTPLKIVDMQLMKLVEDIEFYMVDNPPLSLKEGGLIHDGCDEILDGLRNKIDDYNIWLKEQEKNERNNSGINNLKIQYHRTFGYYISINKSKLKSVPNHWIRRQTLANEERFITSKIKDNESRIFQLKLKCDNREYEIFCDIRKKVGLYTDNIRKVSRAIAGFDALVGLSQLAITNAYIKPNIIENKSKSKSHQTLVKNGRNPIVEQLITEGNFIANNIEFNNSSTIIILTGPNASGKSCFIRQIGLIQILTQIGSWIPAEYAEIEIADRIFTRVGAVDDQASGQSTFMVEMAETASILNQATQDSLVLLDEIGRGTSTFDGLSIAWSVSEYLAEIIQCKTIFATHYHELNSLKKYFNNIANLQVLVKEEKEKIIFCHRIIPGSSHKSYGIEAAKLAGIPKAVTQRASVILNYLEKNNERRINFGKSLNKNKKLPKDIIQ
tara:strand:+ start:1589 stop:4363 length:2775 start_codon:yes stop_codon:yes gene_type:complete